MPTFDFQCAKCKNVFEFSRPFGSKENPKCPDCGSKKTEKMFTAPTIVFKGEGWYKTDSRPKETKETKEPKESKGAKEVTTKESKAAEVKTEKPKEGPKK